MNSLLLRPPSEFYHGDALGIAEAIRQSDHSTLTLLLKRTPGVVSDRGQKNLPILAWAMAHDDVTAFRLLLESGAPTDDFFLVEKAKWSLLSLAAGAQNTAFFDLLLTHHADPNGLPGTEPPLVTAYYARKQDRFDRLLAAGADINHPDKIGRTVILSAVLGNHYAQALDFVSRGADLHVEAKNGMSIRTLIDRYPLPPDSDEGRAQAELLRRLK